MYLRWLSEAERLLGCKRSLLFCLWRFSAKAPVLVIRATGQAHRSRFRKTPNRSKSYLPPRIRKPPSGSLRFATQHNCHPDRSSTLSNWWNFSFGLLRFFILLILINHSGHSLVRISHNYQTQLPTEPPAYTAQVGTRSHSHPCTIEWIGEGKSPMGRFEGLGGIAGRTSPNEKCGEMVNSEVLHVGATFLQDVFE